MNIDILDKVPQLPGGAWVTHFVYGTGLGLGIQLTCRIFGHTHEESWAIATSLVLLLAATKKLYDYLAKGPSQGETVAACVGKTLVTTIGIFLVGFL